MSRPTLAPRPPPGGSAETTQLPAMCSDRSALEAAGVVFGERADRDGLFVHATLPPGWRNPAAYWTDEEQP